MTNGSFTIVDSPIGELLLTASDGRLSGLWALPHRRAPVADPRLKEDARPFREVVEQLDDYWRGELRSFSVELAPIGTSFQLRVWDALRKIPYGFTVSYSELAREIGRPGAARAVGSANARNPISVIVPCHRVIGSSGALTGYAGGLDRKRQLLELEAKAISRSAATSSMNATA